MFFMKKSCVYLKEKIVQDEVTDFQDTMNRNEMNLVLK